jgi:hypothetical protein
VDAVSAPYGDGPGAASDAGRAAQERLTQEARATASALLDWLGTRVDRGAGEGAPSRPAQSAGPCTWCPVCALVAALRGEQPELTARLAEQASGLMALLRLMVQAHQEPGHGHGHQHPWPPPGEHPATPAAGAPPAPPGWPAEWGAWDAWGAAPVADEPVTPSAPAPEPAPEAAAAETDEPETSPGPTGVPGRRRPPVRRASPRSAAFRGQGVPTAEAGTPALTPTPTPTPTPAPAPPPVAEPAPARPARSARPATPPAAGSTARPSVQRIAIRRPARRDGTDGPDSSASC